MGSSWKSQVTNPCSSARDAAAESHSLVLAKMPFIAGRLPRHDRHALQRTAHCGGRQAVCQRCVEDLQQARDAAAKSGALHSAMTPVTCAERGPCAASSPDSHCMQKAARRSASAVPALCSAGHIRSLRLSCSNRYADDQLWSLSHITWDQCTPCSLGCTMSASTCLSCMQDIASMTIAHMGQVT